MNNTVQLSTKRLLVSIVCERKQRCQPNPIQSNPIESNRSKSDDGGWLAVIASISSNDDTVIKKHTHTQSKRVTQESDYFSKTLFPFSFPFSFSFQPLIGKSSTCTLKLNLSNSNSKFRACKQIMRVRFHLIYETSAVTLARYSVFSLKVCLITSFVNSLKFDESVCVCMNSHEVCHIETVKSVEKKIYKS